MVTMEELLASRYARSKLLNIYRGQQLEGEVVAITSKEITLDLGTKSEGIIQAKGIPQDQLDSLKVGDKLKAYVILTENESGQAVLSLERQTVHLEGASLDYARDKRAHLRGGSFRGGRSTDWQKFIQAQNQKRRLGGTVLEVNKGGLIIEIEGARGFLPNSQVGFELLSKTGSGMESLIGQDLVVTVIEIDRSDNKLIFSQRGILSEDIKLQLKSFKKDQKVKGKIIAILPFGLVVDISGMEGLVFISDVSWEKVEDLQSKFRVGEEIDVLIIGIDEELGGLNLSIKQLLEDPFVKLSDKFLSDEMVKGEITEVNDGGLLVKLETGVEGFMNRTKMDQATKYEVGKSISFLIDSVDSKKRRINLAPFVTSTSGLIYK